MMIKKWMILLLAASSIESFASEPRYLPTKIYQKDYLRTHLIPFQKYHPFPMASERNPWSKISMSLKQAYIARGEEALKYDWPKLSASLYLDFKRTGVRTNYSTPHHERRNKIVDLVLAECIEGKGRFLDQIMDGVWAICEESSWCTPYHISAQKAGVGLPDVTEPVVDLFAAETANLMAWTYYLLGEQLDEISPLIKNRVLLETDQRIITLLHQRLDFWWMWTPGAGGSGHHINNWTPWICSNWLTAVLLLERDESRRIDDVYKCMETIDRFLNFYHEDGGCDEGPSYFNHAGGAAFDCLELLFDATAGRINLYNDVLIKNMASYIYKAHIANRYYTNFADAPAVLDIHPFHLYRYGVRINDETPKEQPDSVPLLQDVWLPGIQVMAARERRGTYRAQTFSSRRYEIGTMQSAFHNLPTINGVMQAHGKECKAKNVQYSREENSSWVSMDIADAYELEKVTSDLQFTLMTPCDVKVTDDRLILTAGLSKGHLINEKPEKNDVYLLTIS